MRSSCEERSTPVLEIDRPDQKRQREACTTPTARGEPPRANADRRCSCRPGTAFGNPARGYADVGRNTSGAIFRPGSMMSIPKREFRRLGAVAKATGASVLAPPRPFCSGFTPPRRPSGCPKDRSLVRVRCSGERAVRRNSGLDGAQGAPMPLAPVVIVEFGVSGLGTVGSSARRGDAPLRTAATANADPGTSQIIAV
jgi:hypothetical protein